MAQKRGHISKALPRQITTSSVTEGYVARRQKVNLSGWDELQAWIETVVEQKLLELLGDPDEGLRLRPEVARMLRRRLAEVRQGKRFRPVQEVAQRLGLRW